MTIEQLLRNNQLYDADKGGGGNAGDGKTDDKDTKDDGITEPAGDEPDNKHGTDSDEPKTFTQEELDQIITERLAREKKKREDAVKEAEAEAERKRLEEEGEYKKLYESLQAQFEAEKQKTKKESLLTKAGYKAEQVELFVNLLEGETDEELEASLERLKAATPPERKYVDPSAGNSRKQPPAKKDSEEVGKSAYERLKSLGKIRRK